MGDHIKLSSIIRLLVEDSYSKLLNLTESLLDRRDEERKDALEKYFKKGIIQFTRLLVLIQWSSRLESLQQVQGVLSELGNREKIFKESSHSLHQAIITAKSLKVPKYDINTAVEVLSTGSYPRLPSILEKPHFILGKPPPKPHLDSNTVTETKQRIEEMILLRLMWSRIPAGFEKPKIENGKLLLELKGEFVAVLTLLQGVNTMAPWSLIEVNVQVATAMLGGQKFVTKEFNQKLELFARIALEANPKAPLEALYDVCHTYCQNLQLELLKSQASVQENSNTATPLLLMAHNSSSSVSQTTSSSLSNTSSIPTSASSAANQPSNLQANPASQINPSASSTSSSYTSSTVHSSSTHSQPHQQQGAASHAKSGARSVMARMMLYEPGIFLELHFSDFKLIFMANGPTINPLLLKQLSNLSATEQNNPSAPLPPHTTGHGPHTLFQHQQLFKRKSYSKKHKSHARGPSSWALNSKTKNTQHLLIRSFPPVIDPATGDTAMYHIDPSCVDLESIVSRAKNLYTYDKICNLAYALQSIITSSKMALAQHISSFGFDSLLDENISNAQGSEANIKSEPVSNSQQLSMESSYHSSNIIQKQSASLIPLHQFYSIHTMRKADIHIEVSADLTRTFLVIKLFGSSSVSIICSHQDGKFILRPGLAMTTKQIEKIQAKLVQPFSDSALTAAIQSLYRQSIFYTMINIGKSNQLQGNAVVADAASTDFEKTFGKENSCLAFAFTESSMLGSQLIMVLYEIPVIEPSSLNKFNQTGLRTSKPNSLASSSSSLAHRSSHNVSLKNNSHKMEETRNYVKPVRISFYLLVNQNAQNFSSSNGFIPLPLFRNDCHQSHEEYQTLPYSTYAESSNPKAITSSLLNDNVGEHGEALSTPITAESRTSSKKRGRSKSREGDDDGIGNRKKLKTSEVQSNPNSIQLANQTNHDNSMSHLTLNHHHITEGSEHSAHIADGCRSEGQKLLNLTKSKNRISAALGRITIDPHHKSHKTHHKKSKINREKASKNYNQGDKKDDDQEAISELSSDFESEDSDDYEGEIDSIISSHHEFKNLHGSSVNGGTKPGSMEWYLLMKALVVACEEEVTKAMAFDGMKQTQLKMFGGGGSGSGGGAGGPVMYGGGGQMSMNFQHSNPSSSSSSNNPQSYNSSSSSYSSGTTIMICHHNHQTNMIHNNHSLGDHSHNMMHHHQLRYLVNQYRAIPMMLSHRILKIEKDCWFICLSESDSLVPPSIHVDPYISPSNPSKYIEYDPFKKEWTCAYPRFGFGKASFVSDLQGICVMQSLLLQFILLSNIFNPSKLSNTCSSSKSSNSDSFVQSSSDPLQIPECILTDSFIQTLSSYGRSTLLNLILAYQSKDSGGSKLDMRFFRLVSFSPLELVISFGEDIHNMNIGSNHPTQSNSLRNSSGGTTGGEGMEGILLNTSGFNAQCNASNNYKTSTFRTTSNLNTPNSSSYTINNNTNNNNNNSSTFPDFPSSSVMTMKIQWKHASNNNISYPNASKSREYRCFVSFDPVDHPLTPFINSSIENWLTDANLYSLLELLWLAHPVICSLENYQTKLPGRVGASDLVLVPHSISKFRLMYVGKSVDIRLLGNRYVLFEQPSKVGKEYNITPNFMQFFQYALYQISSDHDSVDENSTNNNNSTNNHHANNSGNSSSGFHNQLSSSSASTSSHFATSSSVFSTPSSSSNHSNMIQTSSVSSTTPNSFGGVMMESWASSAAPSPHTTTNNNNNNTIMNNSGNSINTVVVGGMGRATSMSNTSNSSGTPPASVDGKYMISNSFAVFKSDYLPYLIPMLHTCLGSWKLFGGISDKTSGVVRGFNKETLEHSISYQNTFAGSEVELVMRRPFSKMEVVFTPQVPQDEIEVLTCFFNQNVLVPLFRSTHLNAFLSLFSLNPEYLTQFVAFLRDIKQQKMMMANTSVPSVSVDLHFAVRGAQPAIQVHFDNATVVSLTLLLQFSHNQQDITIPLKYNFSSRTVSSDDLFANSLLTRSNTINSTFGSIMGAMDAMCRYLSSQWNREFQLFKSKPISAFSTSNNNASQQQTPIQPSMNINNNIINNQKQNIGNKP